MQNHTRTHGVECALALQGRHPGMCLKFQRLFVFENHRISTLAAAPAWWGRSVIYSASAGMLLKETKRNIEDHVFL